MPTLSCGPLYPRAPTSWPRTEGAAPPERGRRPEAFASSPSVYRKLEVGGNPAIAGFSSVAQPRAGRRGRISFRADHGGWSLALKTGTSVRRSGSCRFCALTITSPRGTMTSVLMARGPSGTTLAPRTSLSLTRTASFILLDYAHGGSALSDPESLGMAQGTAGIQPMPAMFSSSCNRPPFDPRPGENQGFLDRRKGPCSVNSSSHRERRAADLGHRRTHPYLLDRDALGDPHT